MTQKATTDAINNAIANVSQGFLKLKNIRVTENGTGIYNVDIVDYDENEWNPNYILNYGDGLPSPTLGTGEVAIAIMPHTDYLTNATNLIDVYINSGNDWILANNSPIEISYGDLFSEYPSTNGKYWFGGKWNQLDFTVDMNEITNYINTCKPTWKFSPI